MYTITEYTDWINIDVIDSVFRDPVQANPVTNESQSPCKATLAADESVCTEDLERHHSHLQNIQQTYPVGDHSEGTNRNAQCLDLNSSASPQFKTKRSSSTCSMQSTPKKKNTAKDVYSLQYAVLEKELEKNILQIDLLKKLLCKYENLDSDVPELHVLSVLVK